jgi:hypothetical protein
VSYSAACCASGMSVTNMCPGACVIISSGRLAAATAWDVAPQAQNTGSSAASSLAPGTRDLTTPPAGQRLQWVR